MVRERNALLNKTSARDGFDIVEFFVVADFTLSRCSYSGDESYTQRLRNQSIQSTLGVGRWVGWLVGAWNLESRSGTDPGSRLMTHTLTKIFWKFTTHFKIEIRIRNPKWLFLGLFSDIFNGEWKIWYTVTTDSRIPNISLLLYSRFQFNTLIDLALSRSFSLSTREDIWSLKVKCEIIVFTHCLGDFQRG